MTKQLQPQRGGAAGMTLLLCAVIGGAGSALDFMLRAPGSSWWAQPGARAALGAVIVVLLALSTRLVRGMLGRPDRGGERDRSNPS